MLFESNQTKVFVIPDQSMNHQQKELFIFAVERASLTVCVHSWLGVDETSEGTQADSGH